MATTVWKGYLTFGLVSIPIKLHAGARSEKVSFRQLLRNDATRVRQGYFREPAPAPEEPEEIEEPLPAPSQTQERRGPSAIPFQRPGMQMAEPAPAPPVPEPRPAAPVPVDRSEIVKGFEYEKNKYVVLSKEELAKITPATAREMQILEFVRLAEVDPIYYESSYYVSPDKAGERPYALLYEALRKSGYAAVAQVAMHNREHVVIVRPGRTGIILHRMYYEAEVHREDEYRADTSAVAEKELQLACKLVEALAAPFQPEKYRDTYREKLDELIAAKLAGQQTVESASPQRSAPVVNIMEALERSLAQSARKPAASETEAKAPAPARRRPSGSGSHRSRS